MDGTTRSLCRSGRNRLGGLFPGAFNEDQAERRDKAAMLMIAMASSARAGDSRLMDAAVTVEAAVETLATAKSEGI